MLAKRWGICCNPHTGAPDGVYARTVKLGWIRALVLDFGSWEALCNQTPSETAIAAVITGQSGELANDFWSDGWRERYISFVTDFCERFYRKVRLIEFANEWDFWDNEDRAEKAAELAMIGTNICKNYGILGVLGSVASGDWKAQLARSLVVVDAAEKALGYKVIHGFAFHPYVSYVQRDARDGDPGFKVPSHDWERLSDKVRDARAIAGGRAVAITELGIKIGDAGGLDQQQLYVHGVFQDELSQFSPSELLMATYFCWQDENGAPNERGDAAFGLIAEGGQIRPAYNAATYQMQNAPVVDVPFAALLTASYPAKLQVPPEAPAPIDVPIVPPLPPVPAQRTLTIAEAHGMRWRAVVPSAVYNHDFGFERHWRMPDNAWWGSPVTEVEFVLEDGRPVRIFANAVVAYNGSNDTAEVLE